MFLTESNDHEVQEFIVLSNAKFSLKYMSLLHYFLGVEVTTLSNGGFLLSQTKYTQKVLSKADMIAYKPSHSPIFILPTLSAHLDEHLFDKPSFHRSMVGSLQYFTLTRPHISYFVKKTCQFM